MHSQTGWKYICLPYVDCFPQFVYKRLGHSENNQSTFRYKGVSTFSVTMVHASQSRMYCIHVLNVCLYTDQMHLFGVFGLYCFQKLVFVWLHVYIIICMYIIYISVKMAAPWSSLILLSYYSLCRHLRSH